MDRAPREVAHVGLLERVLSLLGSIDQAGRVVAIVGAHRAGHVPADRARVVHALFAFGKCLPLVRGKHVPIVTLRDVGSQPEAAAASRGTSSS